MLCDDGRALLITAVFLTPSRTGGRIDICTHFCVKPEYLTNGASVEYQNISRMVLLREDLSAATEAAMPASIQCSIVTMDISYLVFEI